MSTRLRPGEVVQFDFREKTAGSSGAKASLDELRIVQWNIERGYELNAILQHLEQLDADVLLLQELDIACARTNFVNVPELIARRLKAHVVFVVEFEELEHHRRKHRDAAGPHAFHGNAIVSRQHTIVNVRSFSHSANNDWERIGVGLREPRKGERCVLTAALVTPHHHLQLYCLHLEVFCGALMRVRQLSDAVFDAQKQLEHHQLSDRASAGSTFHVVIAGDLNTHAHSIVRLSHKYGTDRMKLLSLGETEAEWLTHTFLDPFKGPSRNPLLGLSAVERLKIDNHALFLYDPWDLVRDITLDHPDYRGFASGKLDWLLLSNISVGSKDIGNHDFKASDHKYLVAELRLPRGSKPIDTYVAHRRSWVSLAHLLLWRYVVPFLAALLLAITFLW